MSKKTFKLESEHLFCPSCKSRLDAATAVNEAEDDFSSPQEGDFSICLECGEVLVFCDQDHNMFYKLASKENLDELLLESPATYNQMVRVSKYLKERKNNVSISIL